MSWTFNPSYRFILQKRDPVSRKISTWSLTTLENAQALLVTQAGVGQLTATFVDPGQNIMRNVEPHAMDVVRLQLNNRYGRWANAWTGFVDEVHHIFDPAQGDLVTFNCTSPYKLWEITRETYKQTLDLAATFMFNVTGSTIIKYSARAVGYPLIDGNGKPMLIIDPTADSGSGLITNNLQQLSLDPDQQTWSAMIQGFLADSGLEFFFDENGRAIYRQIGYLGTPGLYDENGLLLKAGYRRIDPDEILNADIVESDKGLVTQVQVRWGQIPTSQMAGVYPADDSDVLTAMESYLRRRQYISYAPWIISNRAAAQYLSQVLWQQLASNAVHALITIPADPYIRIGTVIQVPSLRTVQSSSQLVGGQDLFYVSSITYQLAWSGTWVMTLGLQYGRKSNHNFPYTGGVSAPAITRDVSQDLPTFSNIVTVVPGNEAKIATPYSVVVNSKLSKDQVALPPSLQSGLPSGSTVQLNDKSTGNPIGPGVSSDYTVVGSAATEGTIQIQGNPTSSKQATITIINTQSGGLGSGGGDSLVTYSGTVTTYAPYKGLFQVFPILGGSPTNLTQEFGPHTIDQIAYTYDGTYYTQFHNGIDIPAGGGDLVHSATDGVVFWAAWASGIPTFGSWDGPNGGFGNLIIVKSGGLYVWYGHLQGFNVTMGQSVTHGDVIGYADSTGNSTGNHLHFGVLDSSLVSSANPYGEFVDPRPFFGSPGLPYPTE